MCQLLLEEETKLKLSLNSKLKQIESKKEMLQEQLEEEEESKKNMEKQIVALNLQITESRKKMEEEAEQTALIEAAYKKISKVSNVILLLKIYYIFVYTFILFNIKDMEILQRQIEELQAINDKLEKSKKKLQSELDDINIDLEAQRSKVIELEKKQRIFDKTLAEEKVIKHIFNQLILSFYECFVMY